MDSSIYQDCDAINKTSRFITDYLLTIIKLSVEALTGEIEPAVLWKRNMIFYKILQRTSLTAFYHGSNAAQKHSMSTKDIEQTTN